MLLKIITSLLIAASLTAYADKPATFSQAKNVLEKEIYAVHHITFYCGCSYGLAPNPSHPDRKRLTPDTKSCGLKARKNANRSSRIEWEHIVSAWEFGHQLPCWRKGGRKACKNDPQFRAIESDMMNLVPSVGELNSDRSNFRYGMIEGEPRAYGECDFEVDFKTRVVEPRPEVRGDIARIYFYMSKKYGLKISGKQQKLFESWDRQDPLDEWERERVRRVEKKYQ